MGLIKENNSYDKVFASYMGIVSEIIDQAA
jgi:hypothetical protein